MNQTPDFSAAAPSQGFPSFSSLPSPSFTFSSSSSSLRLSPRSRFLSFLSSCDSACRCMFPSTQEELTDLLLSSLLSSCCRLSVYCKEEKKPTYFKSVSLFFLNDRSEKEKRSNEDAFLHHHKPFFRHERGHTSHIPVHMGYLTGHVTTNRNKKGRIT